MQNVGEDKNDIRIEVRFPDDPTKEEVNELDKDIAAAVFLYSEGGGFSSVAAVET